MWKTLCLAKWLMTRDKTWVSLLVFAHGIPRLVPEASYLETEVHPFIYQNGCTDFDLGCTPCIKTRAKQGPTRPAWQEPDLMGRRR